MKTELGRPRRSLRLGCRNCQEACAKTLRLPAAEKLSIDSAIQNRDSDKAPYDWRSKRHVEAFASQLGRGRCALMQRPAGCDSCDCDQAAAGSTKVGSCDWGLDSGDLAAVRSWPGVFLRRRRGAAQPSAIAGRHCCVRCSTPASVPRNFLLARRLRLLPSGPHVALTARRQCALLA